MKKRILSMLLAIVMVVGLIPNLGLVANAAEDTTDLSVFHGTRTDFRDESVYTLLISRFYDGDSGNNVHCWDDGMAGNPDSDPAWRGDFKGLIEKLDYIKALGFTAVRLNPVVQNASGYDYHGFHPINLMDIDFRLESDGYTYEDLIDACHARGLKVIQGVNLNNTSNFGEENLRKLFELNEEAKWSSVTESLIPTEALLAQYPDYAELTPADQYNARLNMLKAHITETLNADERYHREKQMAYGNYLEQQGQVAGDCVDINTENPEVALYLAESCAWYAQMGVDAVLIDNAHFINRWTYNEGILPLLSDLLKKAGLELDIFYEMTARSLETWNQNNPSASVPFYSWAETEEAWQDNWNPDHPTANIQTSIDHYNAHSVFDASVTPTSDNALLNGITYHTPDYSQSSGMHPYDFTMMWNFGNAYNAFNAGVAGDMYMNDSTWNLLSVDNWDYGPDGMEKTRYSNGVDAWKQNLNLMFTFRGIPSIYYGSEIEFAKGKQIDVGPTAPLANTGRAYYGDHLEGTVTAADFGEYEANGTVADTLNSELSQHIRMLNELRQKIPALRKGQYTTDGNYISGNNMAFIRRYTDANAGIDSLALVTLSGGATFKNIPNGKYVDAVSGNEINVTNGTLTVSSPGSGGLAVYVCCANGFTGLDAELSPAESVLRFNVDGDTTAVSAITTVNGKAQLPAAPELPDGYTFLSWIVNGVEYKPGDTVAISVDSMARANLKKPVAANIASVAVGGDTTEYSILSEAFEAAASASAEGEVILTLLDNITTTAMTTIDSGSFTIDLNGKTWQCSGYLMDVRGEADITIIDNSTEGTGKLLGTGNAYTIMLYGSANLEIAGGTVENNRMAAAIAMDDAGIPSESTLTVSGGKVVATAGDAINAFGKSVTVTGGTLKSSGANIYYKTGVIDLSRHSNPTGITIYNDTGTEVTPGKNTIKLPDGYVMLDERTNPDTVADTLAAYQTYTVGKPVTIQSVEISAVDAANKAALWGATLQILTGNRVVDEWVSTEEANTIEGLNTGVEYTLRAVVAPDGYIIPTDTTFSINADGTLDRSTSTVTVENGILLVEFAKTEVEIKTVDVEGAAIEGATMQILDSMSYVVEEWVSVTDVHTVTGLKTGVAYTLRATKAPDGYAVPADTIFTIDEYGNISTSGSLTEDGILLAEFESAVTTYPLYVGMQQFTENLLTITDSNGGTATYDPQTHTLTLNNFTYSGTGKGYVNDRAAIFYHGKETLTLHLVGKSSITYSGNTSGNNYGFYAYQADVIFSGTGDLTSSGGEAEWFSGGIFVYHDLTLSGTGKLNVIGKNGGGSSQGIYCAGALTISDGTVNITTGEAQDSIGIRGTYGAISVDGGSLNITCGNASNINCGIYTVYGGFVCSDGTVTVTSGNAPNNSYGIYADESDFVLSGGTVTVTGGICGTDEGGYSCGIVAQNISVHGGHLTAVGSTAATSVGIYAFETAALYGGVLEAAGQTQALNMAPAVDSGFANAAVWYGDNAAAASEAKPIGDLANNYSQKYVKVAASEPDTYTVTVRESENGTVTADKTTAAEGETVTITVDPDPGKRVDKVVVKDKNGDPVEVTENPDGTYSYEQPNGNVTIEVSFENIPVYVDPSYRPAIEDSTGGNTTVSDKNPEKGDKVTITTDPDKGYEVGKVTVTDSRGNQVEVKDNGDGTYTYIQPVGSVTIRVTYKPIGCPSEAYSDLDTNAWYHEAADYVLENGLMNGVGSGKFDPNGTTSRAMIWTILARLDGVDTDGEVWYEAGRKWAMENGISDGTMASEPITREQFATILWRYAKYKGYDVSVGEDTNILSYEDAFSISEYAIPAMQWACGAGLMQGDGVNLTPKADATRAQAAALFQRFCENVAEK